MTSNKESPRTHQALKAWGVHLDKETPNGLGVSLIAYAQAWAAEVERLTRLLQLASPGDFAVADPLRGVETQARQRDMDRADEDGGMSTGTCCVSA